MSREDLAEQAHTEITDALEKWVSQWETLDNTIVTGFVVGVEVSDANGGASVAWASGNGRTGNDDWSDRALPYSRIIGIVRTVLIEVEESYIRRRFGEDE